MSLSEQVGSPVSRSMVAEHIRRAAESIPAAAAPLSAGAQLLEPLARATAATRASLLVLNPHTAQLFMLAGIGVPAEYVGHDLPSRPRSIADWVLRHQHGRLFQGEVREEAIEGVGEGRAPDSSLCLPILGPAGPIGVLNLARRAPAAPFEERDYAAVLQALPTLGVALEGLRFRSLAERFAQQLISASAERGRTMVPAGATSTRGWEFAYERQPGPLASSDFCDRVTLPDGGQVVLVADVRGDGVDAALAAAFLQGAFAASGALEHPPVALRDRLVGELSARLSADLCPRFWLVHLAAHGVLAAAGAGTAAALWIPEGAQEPQPLEEASTRDTPGIRLLPGDLVVFASDAVHLAYDPARRGVARARLMEVVDTARRQGVDAIARAIVDGAREASARPASADDIAAFVLRYRPEA